MNIKTEEAVKAGIRIIGSAVPGGGVFVQAWSEYESFRANERLDQFMREFEQNLGTHAGRIAEIERVKQEFPILLERAIDKIRREPSTEKRACYARLLSNSFAANSRVSLDEKLDALDAIEYLTEEDLKVLREYASGQCIRVDSLVPKSQFYQFPPELEEQVGKLVVSLQKLEVRGLLAATAPVNEAFDFIGNRQDWVNVWRYKTYVLLPFGKKFCSLIWS